MSFWVDTALELGQKRVIYASLLVEMRGVTRIKLSLSPLSKGYFKKDLGVSLVSIIAGIKNAQLPWPLAIQGTPFQKRVWNATRTISPGETVSYSELSKRIDSSPRAVGQALGKNPLPLVIPCHRVVGKDGNLRGFSAGVEIKKILLEFEQEECAR